MAGLADEGSVFGPPRRWPESDLIGMTEEFGPELAVQAYRSGVFPMPHHGFRGRQLMGWYSPLDRGILPLDGLKVSRSLRKMIKRYRITVDTAFDDVLRGCADRSRPGGWIDRRIAEVYGVLHEAGVVHSVEAWTEDGRLAGGLYGVNIAGLFAGESMFHHPTIGRDASKAALVGLVDILRADGEPRLLDVQWQTPHLATLGVIEVDRTDYLRRLSAALTLPLPHWPSAE
ncbi:leucyl/phenylalanyl-tRNA--protein transferase [Microlunatus soli]|uniref:Leucyl/phenylalanyl-tRNA--protein transferase n=1 Tax=Microlunatus soli TaxID=630515 RepID=A0A1H1TLI1_9ACTN|nr:leucyl/phenylalanyl-tRNA--protein transferase [Microlunatus soli]SDS60806.1 leucyl/phenylalanyl-tRNA--protein transferase [Microlunatus soli]